jgi:hypothetical protein
MFLIVVDPSLQILGNMSTVRCYVLLAFVHVNPLKCLVIFVSVTLLKGKKIDILLREIHLVSVPTLQLS